MAVEIASKLDYDFERYDHGMSNYTTLSRAMVMDKEVKNFIEKYPD